MCGIAGIYSPDQNIDSFTRTLKAMHRRGPDNAGLWINKNAIITLGQTRLSIIDLTEAANQPMHSRDGRLTIVFNGEIYNYKELRKLLEDKGAIFATHSDTEVILWAWEIFGIEAPTYFRGMFAFAIWDELDQNLILVRDRLGIKPLLWAKTDKGFIFTSSVSAMLASGIINPVLNSESFFDFLATGSVIQPRTIINGVHALNPGTILQVKDFNQISINTYWELKKNEALTYEYAKKDYQELVGRTRFILDEACKFHLVADVPVGSFLSGGVDSTAITAIMAKNSSQRIKTFSIGFEDDNEIKNELSEARSVAEYIGTDHTEILLGGKDVALAFSDFISVLDQPSNDGINTYWVSKIAQPHVKVALSGLGGDEIFGGYSHFAWPTIYKNINSTIIDKTLSKFYNYLPWYGRILNACYKVSDPAVRLSMLRRALVDREIEQALNTNMASFYKKDRILHFIQGQDYGKVNSIYDITLSECKNYLLNTLLRDADALSMGNSIEVRPPLLDHHLVEHALALPDDSKWRNGVSKSILKDATSDLLPPGFFTRTKTGFTLPTTRWVNTDLKERCLDIINSDFADIFFTKSYKRYLTKNISNRYKNQHVYMIFVFLEWAELNKIRI